MKEEIILISVHLKADILNQKEKQIQYYEAVKRDQV